MPRQTRSRAQTLEVALALPGRCTPGRPRSRQQFSPRRRDRRASVPALCEETKTRNSACWPEGHGPRTRSGPCPRRRRPAAGRRPDPCRARWRHSSPRPPPPQRAEGLRLGLQQFHLHGQLSDPLHGAIQFRLHRIALALLERGVDPADRFLTATARAGRSLRPNWRDRLVASCSSRKTPQNDLTLARHRPSLAKSQRAWPAKPGLGKTWTSQGSPAFTTGPSTATFFSKLSVMFRSSLDTSIKPILCPRKSGGLKRFMEEGVAGLLRDKTRPSRIAPWRGPRWTKFWP